MTEIVERKPVLWLRRGIGSFVRQLLWIAGPVLAIGQIVIALKPLSVWPAVVEQFSLQLCGVAVIGFALALLVRRWLWSVLFAVLMVTLALPFWPRSEVRQPPAGAERLRIVSANLWYNARDYHRTLEFLMASDADIIGLVEVIRPWRQVLAPLIAKYPYSVDCADIGPWCESLLLSKLPVVTAHRGQLAPDAPAVAGGELMWGDRRITVLATHLTWPLQPAAESAPAVVYEPAAAPYLPGPLPRIRQAEQADALARALGALPPDLIVMGDFNSAPWSRVQQSFRAATGLANGAGWTLTWPSWLFRPLRLPLDHVLSRGHLVVTDFAAGPETDSDHLPVIAEVGWRD